MTIRGALIGCGYISQRQLWAWKQIPEVEIVAVCDLDKKKAQGRAAEFDIPTVYTDYGRMLDEETLDFVDIATRPNTHLELVAAGAQRGLHVLCQKPVAASLAETQEMISLCQAASVLFMVNENGRHQAWFRKMKSLIDDGRLGTLYNARFMGRWRSTLPYPDFEGQQFFQKMPRLIVYEAIIHTLDTARFLFGEAQTIYARLRRVSPHIAGEDKALLIADFGRLTCLVDNNWYAIPEPGPRGITWGSTSIEGTEGTLVLGPDGILRLFADQNSDQWEFSADTIAQSFVATQKHFIDCLTTGGTPETSGLETLKTMALVFGAYQSSEEGRPMQLSGVSSKK